MKKYYTVVLIALLGIFARPPIIYAQVTDKQATIKLTGEVAAPLNITDTDLRQYTQTTVIRKDRDGNDHTYSGVILAEILKKAGVTMGRDLRGENLSKYAWVEASDGYQVVFALAELDKDFTDRTIILADIVDGKPLAAGDGPFRIIVQDEKKPARCIKQVTAIKIQFAK